MAAASSSVPFFGIRDDQDQYNKQQQQPQPPPPPKQQSSTAAPTVSAVAPQKKKRNLPGNPNPDAEVIALSPKTLLATNRFICEVCNKGFQREQNLQLHRRGHNLPWKLKQKNPKEARRRVYLCPEPNCVHHDPSRALGDLTGIKKHYCRKHGEKKWKCDKCSKRYAVQSDWKAHSKTCGTREYRCDCGTLFSRRDSFITHRAFCDALAQESARLPNGINAIGSNLYANRSINLGLPQANSHLSSLQNQAIPSADLLRLGSAGAGAGPTQFDQLTACAFHPPQAPQPSSTFYLGDNSSQDFNGGPQLLQNIKPFHGLILDVQQNTNASCSPSAAVGNLFNLTFFSNSRGTGAVNNDDVNAGSQGGRLLTPDQFNSANASGNNEAAPTLFAGNLMSNNINMSMSSLLASSLQNDSVVPQMSATALLQKAAQMGATSTGRTGASSLLSSFGSTYSSGGGRSKQHASFRDAFKGSGTGESSRTQAENENHFQSLMNSLANGSSVIFSGENEQDGTGLGGFNRGFCSMDDGKLHRGTGAGGGIGGGSDRLTRDFLGVGSAMRGMGGGMRQREQQLGVAMAGTLDSEMNKSGSCSLPFSDGSMNSRRSNNP